MTVPLHVQQFRFGQHVIDLLVPDAGAMQQAYREEQVNGAGRPFPYWSQVWPASLALCEWLSKHPEWVRQKKVMELGAGLGLPSLLAAGLAQEVHCTDHSPDAIDICRQSAIINKLSMHCEVMDWNKLPSGLTTGVLLLSDVNYEPGSFERLYEVLLRFLHAGTTILLSSPQRLMAGPFIERLLPYCILREEITVPQDHTGKVISLFVLRKN